MYAPRVKAPLAKTASQTTPTCASKPPQRTLLPSGAGLGNQARLQLLRSAAQKAELPLPHLQRKLAIGPVHVRSSMRRTASPTR